MKILLTLYRVFKNGEAEVRVCDRKCRGVGEVDKRVRKLEINLPKVQDEVMNNTVLFGFFVARTRSRLVKIIYRKEKRVS